MIERLLLVVNEGPLGREVVKHFDPVPPQRRKIARKRRSIIQEVADRSTDENVAGSSRRKIMTAYRENAILIACCLNQLGPSSPKTLRFYGTGEKTTSILANNHYRWFQRVERGIYRITDQGAVEAASHTEIYRHSESILQKAANNMSERC